MKTIKISIIIAIVILLIGLVIIENREIHDLKEELQNKDQTIKYIEYELCNKVGVYR